MLRFHALDCALWKGNNSVTERKYFQTCYGDCHSVLVSGLFPVPARRPIFSFLQQPVAENTGSSRRAQVWLLIISGRDNAQFQTIHERLITSRISGVIFAPITIPIDL